MAVVGLVRGAVVVVGLGHDQDVVTTTEGVLENGSGAEVDIGVVAGGLVRRRAIEVPLTEVGNAGDLLADSLKSRTSDGEIDGEMSIVAQWSCTGARRGRRSTHLRRSVRRDQ